MEKQLTKEVLALRKLRELKQLDRKGAAILLGLSHKTIERFENGRSHLSERKIHAIVAAYGYSLADYESCLRGEMHSLIKKAEAKKPKVIEHKNLRRSYKKIITKDVLALISLRKMKGFSQSEAGKKCGYSKSSIGHIENGRIELCKKRIKHIVVSYGFKMDDFVAQKRADIPTCEIQDNCVAIIRKLDGELLTTAHALLKTMKFNPTGGRNV